MASTIVVKFEENLIKAKQALESANGESMVLPCKMVMGDNEIFLAMPRIQVKRGFLMNHLYHHRGELVVYLSATGNTVPGLYGPAADDRN